jgi:hypothetical protein
MNTGRQGTPVMPRDIVLCFSWFYKLYLVSISISFVWAYLQVAQAAILESGSQLGLCLVL